MSDTESFPSLTDTSNTDTSNTNTSTKNKTRKIPKTAASYLPPVKAPNSNGSLFYTRENVAANARRNLLEESTRKVNRAFNQDAVYEENLETGKTVKIGPTGQRYPVSLPPITKGGIKTKKAKRSKKTRKHKRRSSTSKKPHRKTR